MTLNTNDYSPNSKSPTLVCSFVSEHFLTHWKNWSLDQNNHCAKTPYKAGWSWTQPPSQSRKPYCGDSLNPTVAAKYRPILMHRIDEEPPNAFVVLWTGVFHGAPWTPFHGKCLIWTPLTSIWLNNRAWFGRSISWVCRIVSAWFGCLEEVAFSPTARSTRELLRLLCGILRMLH